jgi:hypothetical protein
VPPAFCSSPAFHLVRGGFLRFAVARRSARSRLSTNSFRRIRPISSRTDCRTAYPSHVVIAGARRAGPTYRRVRATSSRTTSELVDLLQSASYRRGCERLQQVGGNSDSTSKGLCMRRAGHLGRCPVSFAECGRRAVSVVMDRSVPTFVLEELAKHPHCEEGGKYLGFIENESESAQIVITDFLPGGPKAKRTRVEFLPDGDFQERLFRQAERLDRRVEHLGSWNSHHCNGLGTFSEGDIAGYFKTVNKAHYRPDFFVASLVTRIPQSIDERDWLQHFLFVRGDDQFYRLDTDLRMVMRRRLLEK